MKTFAVIVVIIAFLVIIIRVRRSFQKYKAALNALTAKCTFLQLDEDTQATVNFRSWRVLEKMGFDDPTGSLDKMSELKRCSVYALAMAEMEIPPCFDKEAWHYVKRPFVTLINADRALAAAKNHLKKTYGVKAEIES